MKYQGKRPDQIQFAEKLSAYSFLALVVVTILLMLLY